jgi:hypothetical protein
MIRRLILAKQSLLQLSIVMFGSLFGLLLVMGSLQLFLDFRQLLTNKEDLISPQFLVVNKQVNVLNTLTGNSNYFTDDEISEFEQVTSVEKIGKFKANLFKAKTAFDFMGNSVYADMFFEAVPQDFLDIKTDLWQWQEGGTVPIILPADYINLYNFGFAPSQGMPQISQGTAQMAALKVRIEGQGKTLELPGRIAGFTNRINSILVPESFLDYANKNYGETKSPGPSRIVVVTNDPSSTALSEYITEKGYETNLELLKNGRLNAVLKLILAVVLAIGAVIVLLSISGFVQYAQLLINNARFEIRTLIQIGYPYTYLFRYYMVFYTALCAGIAVAGFILLAVGKVYFNRLMQDRGFEMQESVSPVVYGAGVLMLLVFLLVNAINLYRMCRQLAKPA